MNRSVFVIGPTASGKTSLASSLAHSTSSIARIINADAFQAYRQISIGTARPTPDELESFPHELFDCVDCISHAFDASSYRAMVKNIIANDSPSSTQLDLIVGGSLFYVRTLFYRLQEAVCSDEYNEILPEERQYSWQRLNELDPERAKYLHPHDTYRVNRALDIFYDSGTLPSECKPIFDPLWSSSLIVFIVPDDTQLLDAVKARTTAMLDNGWLQEVEALIDTPYESFVAGNYVLGYQLVYDWIKRGKNQAELEQLKQDIIQRTWRYTRRQLTFWRTLKRDLIDKPGITIHEIAGSDFQVARQLVQGFINPSESSL